MGRITQRQKRDIMALVNYLYVLFHRLNQSGTANAPRLAFLASVRDYVRFVAFDCALT